MDEKIKQTIAAVEELHKQYHSVATLKCLEALRTLPPSDQPTDAECFTVEQVANLQKWQDCGHVHPFTCGTDSRHPNLVPTVRGWICQVCDYRQNWAHDFMKDGEPPPNPFALQRKPAIPEWMPIETAPNDSTMIMGYVFRGDISYQDVVWRRESDGQWTCGQYTGLTVTRWLPLPAAPKPDESGKNL